MKKPFTKEIVERCLREALQEAREMPESRKFTFEELHEPMTL